MIGGQRVSLQSQNLMAGRRQQQPDPDGNSLPRRARLRKGIPHSGPSSAGEVAGSCLEQCLKPTTPANDPKWRPHLKEIASEGPLTVGSKVHQVVAGPGGRGIPADIEVTAYEPPRHYALKVTVGPARPTGDFRLAAAGAGTELTFSLSADLAGLKKLFMSGPVQKSMDGEMASLDTAKRLIEGS